jgi:predicted DCC family thiol-disulfide oxidoreductase YuxK
MPRWYPALGLGTFVVARLTVAGHALFDGHSAMAAAFLLIALLVLGRTTALLGWALSLGVGLGLASMGEGSWSAAWVLHLISFQPAWIPKRPSDGRTDLVLYDGSCGLCHGAVRFLVAEDGDPPRLRFAPLGGETCAARVPEDRLRALPDSVLVITEEGVLVRSAAAVAILERLGGWWGIVAMLGRLVPVRAADALYDAVAARRRRWFGIKDQACPLLPADLRSRFDT